MTIVDALSQRFSGKVENIQRRCADRLNKKVEKWSSFRIKVLLVVFILSYVTVTVLVLVRAGSSSDSHVRVQPIIMPQNVMPRGDYGIAPSPMYLTDRIKQFRKLLDSLKNDKRGRIVYDSLMIARPGLIDSLIQLEALDNNK